MSSQFTRGIRYAVIASEGVDRVFYCWSRVKAPTTDYEEEFKTCNASEFWHIDDRELRYTEFTYSKYVKPRGYITVSLRSRELFKYGVLELLTILPRYENGPLFWFGFELDDLFGGGVVHYMWDSGRGVLKAYAGSFGSRVELDLTKYTPQDADRTRHLYKIVRRDGLALWYIDNRLRGMAILSTGDLANSGTLYTGRPYTIGVTVDIPSLALPVLLDIDGGDLKFDYEWPQLHPWCLRVSEGESRPLILLDLYVEGGDEKLQDLLVEEEVVSAPFPGTLEYKEIVFASKGSGTLSLESLAGREWLVYEEYEIEERRLYSIKVDDSNLLYRVRYKPRSRSRITVARVVLK